METSEIKDIYNKIIKEKYKGDYEYNRWFKTSFLKAGYDMARRSIEFHLFENDRLKFKNYLELGPGAGTWTKLFLERYNQVSFDLVDISQEMLEIAKRSLSQYKNIRFFETDFLKFSPEKKYDFFFSSRAIEYFSDKRKTIKYIASLLQKGGQGFIITKTPQYLRNKILGRKISEIHKGQISPEALKEMLEKNDFGDIEIYPVAMIFPILKSVFLNKLFHRIFYKHQLNFVSEFFSESYCVKFTKK